MTTSFLHAASAKAVAEKLRGNQANFFADGRGSNENSLLSLRMLLVEEEYLTNNTGEGSGGLARSLVMDAAYSLVSGGSAIPCRGCCEDDVGGGETNDNEGRRHTPMDASPVACQCCRVALLVPGEPKKSKKKRRRNNGGSKFLGDTGKVEFPMWCVQDVMKGDGERGWDSTLLGQIQIKYVNSLEDVVRYLAYCPSLPEHLQPLDGVLLFGMGELLSRQNNIMELTHLLSMLSDTANALENNKRELLKLNPTFGGNVAVIATIDKFSYSSIPPKVIRYIHQWMDFTASIRLFSDATAVTGVDNKASRSDWELVFNNMGILGAISGKSEENETAFGFKVNLCEPSHEIAWKV